MFVKDGDDLWEVYYSTKSVLAYNTLGQVDEYEPFEDGVNVLCLYNITLKKFFEEKLGVKKLKIVGPL